MANMNLYYATNRKHKGDDRFHPTSYGTSFSADGMENLRFGKVTIDADMVSVEKYLKDGDGEKLAGYFTNCAKSAKIEAYKEEIDKKIPDTYQSNIELGSRKMFDDLKKKMDQCTDTLIFIHGYNVSWSAAVGSALSLQSMLNRPEIGDKKQEILVVLFTWPSDGMALPYTSYRSDRSDAKASGCAFGRGFLKLRDYLIRLNSEVKKGEKQLCSQNIHLLCHSMGNYVLQNALGRIIQFSPAKVLPRIFEHIFLCSADVDDDVLETGQSMNQLHELSRYVNIYYNRQDVALNMSDNTKSNPERLGTNGAAHPALLHNKVHQIDCTPIVHGLFEHGYYLWKDVNEDIRLSMDSLPFNSPERKRRKDSNLDNMWVM